MKQREKGGEKGGLSMTSWNRMELEIEEGIKGLVGNAQRGELGRRMVRGEF